MSSREVVLYGREGCHLCDEARELLISTLAEVDGYRLREVDIDADEELHKRFLERIPVIELDGRIVSELVPDPGSLRSNLLHTSSA